MLFFAIMSYICSAAVVVGVVSLIIAALCKIFNKEDLKVAIIVAVLFIITAIVALSPAASRAEELPDGFYYKVVFIDEVEEFRNELLIHTDDLDHLWDYYEEFPEDGKEFDSFDKELSNIALWFVLENDLYAEFNKEERVTEGRIVVLTMWECTDDPFDDEIVDVYYSELITR